jgi:membrane-bound ClpP family serine protease
MKTTIKKYAGLCLCLALIAVGSILLMLDYKTMRSAWLGLFGAVAFFSAGLWLGHVLDRKNLLPDDNA